MASFWPYFLGSSNDHNWAKRDRPQWYIWGTGIGKSGTLTAMVGDDDTLRQGPNNT